MRRTWLLFLLAGAIAACDSKAPEDDERDEEELTFVQLRAGAQAEVTQASFWAVRGQTRSVVIRHANQSAGEPPLLEFVVGAQSLLTHPDGRPVLLNDSVRITVNVDAQQRLVFDLQPAGLIFSPLNPALLRMHYGNADPDYNRDGVVNQLDAAIEQRLRIWKQEVPGLPWLPIPTFRVEGSETLEGHVTHFTGFAMAS